MLATLGVLSGLVVVGAGWLYPPRLPAPVVTDSPQGGDIDTITSIPYRIDIGPPILGAPLIGIAVAVVVGLLAALTPWRLTRSHRNKE
ncbi:hypothetical protein ACHIPZ_03895 [Antrihabitans sp. NCIMB 15449]|uniref:PDGLE domain-containing protein n=1 Tax=Antrihabitans spumae TaxID=3373370 RepID=A0ABW7JHB3_9NOCA